MYSVYFDFKFSNISFGENLLSFDRIQVLRKQLKCSFKINDPLVNSSFDELFW